MQQVYYIKPNKRIDFRYWLLRKMTGISEHICTSLNRSYAKIMLKLYKSGSHCHELFIT